MALKGNLVEFDLAFLAMERLIPALDKLAADEWENDLVKMQLECLRNEFTARLQHAAL